MDRTFSGCYNVVVDQFSPLAWKKPEIIFVSVVLGVLLCVSWFQLLISQMRTRDAQRKADVELVARALDNYLFDHLVLPASTADGKIVACGRQGQEVCEWDGGPIIDDDDVVYIKKLPIDPFAHKGRTYVYEVDETRQKYTLYVAVEYSRDDGRRDNLTKVCGPSLQCNWYVKN